MTAKIIVLLIMAVIGIGLWSLLRDPYKNDHGIMGFIAGLALVIGLFALFIIPGWWFMTLGIGILYEYFPDVIPKPYGANDTLFITIGSILVMNPVSRVYGMVKAD